MAVPPLDVYFNTENFQRKPLSAVSVSAKCQLKNSRKYKKPCVLHGENYFWGRRAFAIATQHLTRKMAVSVLII